MVTATPVPIAIGPTVCADDPVVTVKLLDIVKLFTMNPLDDVNTEADNSPVDGLYKYFELLV